VASILAVVAQSSKSLPDPGANRSGTTPVSGAPFTGVDTIRGRWRYRTEGLTNRRTSERLVRPTGELVRGASAAHEVLPETGVSVRADERYGKHITFEVSVPRQRTGSNLRASSPVEVWKAVQAIHAETSKYADLLDDWDDLQVSRLDLVRDLHGVPDIAQVLDRLAQVPSRGKTRQQYNDPRRGGAQTLRVSTARRWSVTAYDKAAEQTSAAGRTSDPERRAHHLRQAVLAKGQLRTEVGLRSRASAKLT